MTMVNEMIAFGVDFCVDYVKIINLDKHHLLYDGLSGSMQKI